MDKLTYDRLKRLEAKHSIPKSKTTGKTLRAYYGWARLNKVQKREAITVFFENEVGAGSETSRSYKTMTKLLDVVYERRQTEKEMEDAKYCNRVFTAYEIFMDDKAVQGSLERALAINSEKDRKHVPQEVRDEIARKLRARYLETHPDYREPVLPPRQLELQFEED